MALLSEAHPRASHSTCSGISVSFEFFPPQTEEMEEILWASIKRLAPLCARIRLGHLWRRRRRRASAPMRRSRGSCSETTIKPAAHLTCVGAHLRGNRRHRPRLLGHRRAPYRGPARRSAWGARHGVRAASAGLRQFDCARRGLEEDRRFRNHRLGLSRRPSRKRLGRSRHRRAEGQDRCGRDARHHAVLLRERGLSCAFSTRCRRMGIDIPIVPGIVPVQNFRQTARFARRAGASIPQWLADRFEGLDDDPTTRRLIAATVAAEQVFDLVDARHRPFPFLHDEPRRSRLCDLPSARPEAENRNGSRLSMDRRAPFRHRRTPPRRWRASAFSCSTAPWAR